MRLLRDVSIKQKLTIIMMMTSTVALVLAGAAFLTYELIAFRDGMITKLSALAGVIGSNSSSSLVFGDKQSAEETLGALDSEQHVTFAAIYNANGVIFATYSRDSGTVGGAIPLRGGDEGHEFHPDDVTLFREIFLDGEKVGTVFLRSDLTEMDGRLRQYAGILLTVLVCSSLVALLLSSKLQRVISAPILHLATTARVVSDLKDYSVRAVKHNKDEIGELIGGFNEMLAQIQERDAALQSAHNDLELRVLERTHALQQEVVERKRAEEQIHEQAMLIDEAQDAILVEDIHHRVVFWNKSAARLYGWTLEEIRGRNAHELLYKSPQQSHEEAERTVLANGYWMGEIHQVTRHGANIIVESRWTLLTDDQGNPKSVLIVNTDITQKKSLEAQFLRAQRIESIGTLAGGIAHDINNVLSPILLALDVLKRKHLDEQSQRMLQMLESSAKRGSEMVKHVLSFARGMEGEQVSLQPRYLIKEMEKMAKETFPRSISIVTDVPADLWSICGDPTQLHQVLLNLMVNARDAISGEGSITISSENIRFDEHNVKYHIDAKIGPYVLLRVEDTGVGIPPKIIEKIFDPFFTTKERGKGTGLGLSTVLAIVKSHGGFVNVYTEVGKGTTFKVYLPAEGSARPDQAETRAVQYAHGKDQLVLVIDDEVAIREITRETLEANGYKVLVANDGTAALPLLARHQGNIKLILTDMMMPYMDGAATIQAIRKLDATVNIVVVSGLLSNEKTMEIAGLGVQGYVAKPFTTEKLLKLINDILNREPIKVV